MVTNTVEARKALGARLALSVLVSLVLAVATPALLMNGAAWGLVAGAVVLAIAAGVDAMVVADRMLSRTPAAKLPAAPHDLAA
ncbi:MAG: hypothetical protein ACRDO8_01170 [Nocardioidaceae bacterium]